MLFLSIGVELWSVAIATRTTGGGTYKVVGATGVFAGGTGHGSYDLTFTSQTDFISHWKGVFAMPKQVGSR